METSAVISPDGLYRYRLSRIWEPERLPLVWIMLNPSTADASLDDPTIRRCMGFARRENHGGIEVVNLFALRSTSPKALYEDESDNDPVGPDNDGWIHEVLHPHHQVVLGWGSHGATWPRTKKVLATLRVEGLTLLCLGVTNKGEPRHPLYVKSNQPFIQYL